MIIKHTDIPAVQIIKNNIYSDNRGYFFELYSKEKLKAKNIITDFSQDNISLSVQPGTIRGLHFQIPPFAQTKLLTVLKGEIMDVVVDIRHDSPTYGKYVMIHLKENSGDQLYIPDGFAHGFCTLVPDTFVSYKVSNVYSKEHEQGILWCDPDLKIPWPLGGNHPLLSQKDEVYPCLKEIPRYF